jgi:multidrug efflux pump subunit AcrA (membrane-fusion protein)
MPVAVARCNPSRDMELAAEFRPYQEIDVYAKATGYLKEIRVDVGDHVKKGEILAILEIPELAQGLEEASAIKSRKAELILAIIPFVYIIVSKYGNR